MRRTKKRKSGKIRCGFTLLPGLLGEGSFGKVFRAKDENDVEVALKVESSQEKKSNTGLEPEVVSEVALNLALQHPNIFSYSRAMFDCETSKEPALLLVGEIANGGDLQDWLTSHGQDLTSDVPVHKDEVDLLQRLKIANDIICGMAWLHANGILHRDFKPRNVFIFSGRRYEGGVQAKIGDFGLSNLKWGAEIQTKGTLKYFPPEELCEVPVPWNEAADWWGVGVTLHYLFFEREPYLAAEGSSTSTESGFSLNHQKEQLQKIIEFRGRPPKGWWKKTKTEPCAPKKVKVHFRGPTWTETVLDVDFEKYKIIYGDANTTDLATLIDRLLSWNPRDRIISPVVLAPLYKRLKKSIPTCRRFDPKKDRPQIDPLLYKTKILDWIPKGTSDVVGRATSYLWYRLHCIDSKTFKDEPDEIQEGAILSLGAKILGRSLPLTNQKPKTIKTQQKMIETLDFNFYGSSLVCSNTKTQQKKKKQK